MEISPSYLLPPMPPALDGLAELALDMRWSWSHAADVIWQRLDPELWERTRNPWLILQTQASDRLEVLAEDRVFVAHVQQQIKARREALEVAGWFQQSDFTDAFRAVAYFSMEFGLSEALPIYSGGLGILAGDCLKTASDLGVPLVGIGLLYQQGYFRQMLDSNGVQREFFPYNDPVQMPVIPVRDRAGKWLRVMISLPGRALRLQVWQAMIGRVRLYLLDSNDPLNIPPDRGITGELYGGGAETRLQQEMILGIGGWRVLRALDIVPEVCHLNEGHAAFAVLERARCFAQDNRCSFEVALTATRAGNLFTTHTPVEAGFDRFSPALIGQYLRDYCDELGIGLDDLMALGRCEPACGNEDFNMAWLAVRGAGAVNGVSRLHGKVSRRIFQPLFRRWPQREVPVGHVTNGVHVPSWDSAEADSFWTRTCGKDRWLGSLDNLEEALKQLPDEAFWALRIGGRQQLIHYAREKRVQQLAEMGAPPQELEKARRALDPNALTLCFARRFVEYKRPNLLLTDPERLARLLTNPRHPVQIILAGKAHPLDQTGKGMIQAWNNFIENYQLSSRVVFLSDYDMLAAEQLVQGADVWINTPRRPWEASGTSGMKVLVNGGLNLSELDGWWAEAWRPEVGWAIGNGHEHGDDPRWDVIDAEALYQLLEQEVIPCFYRRDEHGVPREWVVHVRASISELTPQYSTNRMLREYTARYYAPLATAYRHRIANQARLAVELDAWQKALQYHWSDLHFGDLEVSQEGQVYHFRIQAYLDEIDPDAVRVELYADPHGERDAEVIAMERRESLTGAVNSYLYTARVAAQRPASDYTPRLIAQHADASIPLEAPQILWLR